MALTIAVSNGTDRGIEDEVAPATTHFPPPLGRNSPRSGTKDSRGLGGDGRQGSQCPADWPPSRTGVHATIVTITKGIGSKARFDSAALAQAYLELHNQPETERQAELVT
jgi:hypothetical protein